ncbi:Tn3 family transposase [Actinoplanes sp. NEAU-A12]|uniref:Tn3 family transposase n=1 Tax=Actinoplanes sandaracinus TaxID=3045177 RepID=A0ABT6WZF9_9ACTN|nr:Tn3 family transposase [Actinoplanes sandaracinus]MDI6105112.1 Tn3 family transposase [Actinoplanes sandaracinus]
MASIERTAYPRFKRFLSARELHVFYTPQPEEIAWASGQVRSDSHLLAFVVQLKCFSRMGYFPRLDDVPEAVMAHIRRDLGLGEDVVAVYDSDRTRGHHRMLIRRRSEVVSDMPAARAVAAAAIREAAGRKNDPADLINVALEKLVEGSFELPGYSTLDEMAAQIREEVNSAIFALVAGRIGPAGVAALDRMLVAGGAGSKSDYNRLKRTAPRPSWTNYRLQIEHLRWVDSLGDSRSWWEGIARSKIADFAGEGEAGDAAVLGDYGDAKRIAILAAMVYAAQQRARDDTAEMFCRRVATLTKRARLELEELKKQQQKVTEALIVNYRQVLEHLDPLGPAAAQHAAALEMARKTVEAVGGFPEELGRIDAVRATHGDNHVPLVARHFRKDRSSMLATVGVLDLEATSADRSVLQLLDYMREHTMLTRDHIPDRIAVFDETGRPVTDPETGEQRVHVFDTSFASENWNKSVRDRARPGMFVRRHLEACVLTYLAEELRTGDIAVTGAQAYANWADQLLTPAEVAVMLPGFCAEVGIPASAAGFRADLHERLDTQCRATDAAYPDLADFTIDEFGRPSLKQFRAAPPTPSAQALALAVRDRMPERTLMGILARTGHWLEWWRRFSPVSGSDPKLKDPFVRYILTTFTYGTNLGPAQAARHIAGVTAHELATTSARHVTIGKLNKAIADVVDAFTELDLIKVWGDGSVVAADGTQVDTFIDNLLAETSIRYGGTGGIAYHYVSDTYIALFSKFIPVGVWEAVHIIQGLLDQQSTVKPGTIHADTQGQALPVYALAHLCGFELMPRVRNWKDLNFYRVSAATRFRHIEALFGEPGRNVIDWDLIERHYDDLMRVVLSVAAGKISSVTLLRRLSTYSRRNNFYKAFREVGRVIRTIQLLRYLSDPQLRRRTTAATNKVESYNNFSAWCRFGNEGRVRDNDPAEQEKHIKFSTLLTNAVIFHTTLDMMSVLRQLAVEGWEISPEDLAVLSPYQTMRINRFGVYATDEITVTPEQYDAHLPDIDLTLEPVG